MLGCTPWALLFPLPLDKKRSPCSRAGFILGGSLHAKTHRPDLLASICCMSAGLSLIHVACLLGYPWFQVLCSTVWGLWCDYTVDHFLLPGFASFMTPQKTPSPPHISSCIRVWNLSVSYLQTTSYSVTLSRRLAEERRLPAQSCERNTTCGSEPNEVITHREASSMRIKLESVLPWPSSPTLAN